MNYWNDVYVVRRMCSCGNRLGIISVKDPVRLRMYAYICMFFPQVYGNE